MGNVVIHTLYCVLRQGGCVAVYIAHVTDVSNKHSILVRKPEVLGLVVKKFIPLQAWTVP